MTDRFVARGGLWVPAERKVGLAPATALRRLRPISGGAGVTFDAKLTGGNGANGENEHGTQSIISLDVDTITVGAGATLLTVPIVWQRFVTPTSIVLRWDDLGTPQTMVQAAFQAVNNGSDFLTVAWYRLVNPTPGNKRLHVEWAGSLDCYVSGISWTGTDTVTGINASDTVQVTAATTVTVTSSSDGATAAVWGCNGAAPTVNFTRIFAESPFNPGGGAGYQLGGTSNGHTFTGAGGTINAGAGIHVIAAAAAGGWGSLLSHDRGRLVHV